MALDRAAVLNIVRMVRFFDAGGEATSGELADRYGVCRRTAQRWLSEIQAIVPLERKIPGCTWRKRRRE